MPSHSQSDWVSNDQDEYKIKSNLSSFSMIDRRLATFCQSNRVDTALSSTISISSSTSETLLSLSSSCSTPSGCVSFQGRDGEEQSSPTNGEEDLNGDDETNYLHDDDEIMQCRREADTQEALSEALSQASPDSLLGEMRTNAADFASAIKQVSESLLRMQHGEESYSPAYSEEVDTDQLGRVKYLLEAKIEKDKSEGDRTVAVAALEKELLQWPKTLDELSQNEVSELKSSLSTIEVTLHNSQDESADLKIDNQTMATEISALSTLCAMLSAEKGELKKSLQALQDSHEELEEDIIALVEEVETKVAEIDLLSELSAFETSDLRGRLREVEDDNSVFDRSFIEHDEQREQNEAQIRDIETEVACLRESIAHADAKRHEVEIEKAKLAEEVESLSVIASNGMAKEEKAQELIRTLVDEMRKGTDHFNSEIEDCKSMLKDIEQRNCDNEAETSKIAAAFEKMAYIAARRLIERDAAELRLHAIQSEMEKETELYKISIKAHAMEVELLRETNARVLTENEKLISQTLSTNSPKLSTPLKQVESPMLEVMVGGRSIIKDHEADFQRAQDSCKLTLFTNAAETGDTCGVDLDNGLALREAASRLKCLSDQESPSPRASKGLRLGKKKQGKLTQHQNRPDVGTLKQRKSPELDGVQQFLWLCALWSLTLLLCAIYYYST